MLSQFLVLCDFSHSCLYETEQDNCMSIYKISQIYFQEIIEILLDYISFLFEKQ